MSSTTQLAEVASSSKRKFLNSEEEYLPAFLRDDEIIAPLKCDVTMAGARYVDTFSWNIYNSAISPDEFASRTCADLVIYLSLMIDHSQYLNDFFIAESSSWLSSQK